IKPLTALPAITTPTIIDGYSQIGANANTLDVGNNAILRIEIDGSKAPQAFGLVLTASNVTIKGLVINSFPGGPGIYVNGDSCKIKGNFIGTESHGDSSRGNNTGIDDKGDKTEIGGSTPADRNLVSGNKGVGITVGTNSQILGNYV